MQRGRAECGVSYGGLGGRAEVGRVHYRLEGGGRGVKSMSVCLSVLLSVCMSVCLYVLMFSKATTDKRERVMCSFVSYVLFWYE